MRENISSGAVWEDVVGYSRVVRIGNIIEVAGTTAVDGDIVIAKGDVYGQTLFILQKIEFNLRKAGVEMKDVIRTRMYITNIEDWEAAGRAHGEFFNAIKPVTTMVEVSALINPDLLIEIEATAVVE